jgi:hypothetical protein
MSRTTRILSGLVWILWVQFPAQAGHHWRQMLRVPTHAVCEQQRQALQVLGYPTQCLPEGTPPATPSE